MGKSDGEVSSGPKLVPYILPLVEEAVILDVGCGRVCVCASRDVWIRKCMIARDPMYLFDARIFPHFYTFVPRIPSDTAVW